MQDKNIVNKKNSVGILQGEVAFTCAEANRHILGSYYTTTCVNVAILNPKTKQLAFVHFDAAAEIQETLKGVNKKLNPNGNDTLNIYLGAPYKLGNSQPSIGIFKALKQMNWKVTKTIESSSMAFDAKSGAFIEKVTKEQLDNLGIDNKRRNQKRMNAILSHEGQPPTKTLFDGIEKPKEESPHQDILDFLNSPTPTKRINSSRHCRIL